MHKIKYECDLKIMKLINVKTGSNTHTTFVVNGLIELSLGFPLYVNVKSDFTF